MGGDFGPADSFEAEEDADLQMQAWGFDAVAMDEWDREHGITGSDKIDPDTPKGKKALARSTDDFFRKGR